MKKQTKSDYMKRLRSLIEIGVALSSEKELNRLLSVILEKAIYVTEAEGASIYLFQEKAKQEMNNVVSLQKESVLRFLKSTNRREGQKDRSGVLPIDETSIAGFVAMTKDILIVNDCYKIPEDAPYKFNKSYDQDSNYKTKSMLTIPMITADGKVRGVLQLVNKLTDEGLEKVEDGKAPGNKNIIEFSQEDQELMRVFASYSAIALENSQLTESIENLF